MRILVEWSTCRAGRRGVETMVIHSYVHDCSIMIMRARSMRDYRMRACDMRHCGMQAGACGTRDFGNILGFLLVVHQLVLVIHHFDVRNGRRPASQCATQDSQPMATAGQCTAMSSQHTSLTSQSRMSSQHTSMSSQCTVTYESTIMTYEPSMTS